MKRPTITKEMKLVAAREIADKVRGDADTIAEAYHYPVDGYELARKLDLYHGWCDLAMCDVEELDCMDSLVRHELKKAEKAWAAQEKPEPPYLGLAEKFYGAMHPNAAEYDKIETHAKLVERMMDEYDTWAMSLHVPALRQILGVCPADVRVAAWVKPFASFKRGVTRAWTWEPVIFSFHRARKRTMEQRTWRDHIAEPITLRRGFQGAKPERFCFWLFEGMNLEPDDDFCDLFPGSGAVTAAWERWREAQKPVEQQTLLAV